MTRRGKVILGLGLAALVAGGLGLPGRTQAGVLQRLLADTMNFNNDESATSATAGTLIYNTSLYVPTGMNVLYLTFVATGDVDQKNAQLPPAALRLRCILDGASCNPGATTLTDVGWIVLQNQNAHLPDNGIAYTWCRIVKPGNHKVQFKLGSSNGGRVAVEAVNIFVDAAAFDNPTTGCNNLDAPQPTVGITGNAVGQSEGVVGIQGN